MIHIEKLLEIAKNPEPFEEGTQEIWLDPDRADLVLKGHFDENIPGASRDSSFIDETIDFVNNLAPVENYNTVERSILVFDDGELVNYNYWNQNFSIEDLEKEVDEAGFTLEKVYADVNGGEYVNNSESFAAVLKKK
ncbi:hypothetical protein NDS46_12595 [Paenibacillus thiaminolyticus]|uniref:hypothetical protein n=1 Tax=Paenibacillus thiaminolyticus TaxID=49283 RepID=UPI00232D7C1A|nr:hypothetical protein [Paenibacillus thiaminolyticus]WCF10624.1 hypothetical protein NDS46_12595 [Paenibacillus thiaminolyticus]